MKIVVLDANPTTFSADYTARMQALGELAVYDRTAPDEVIPRAKDAEIVLTNKVVIDDTVMTQLPRLRYVGVLATGYNVVDIATAKQRGIVVTNIPAYSTDSVAQMVFAHLLNITNAVGHHAAEVRKGRWQQCPDFCFTDTPQIELVGKTMCLVGLGNTGMATARLAQAFGMKVYAFSSKSSDNLQQLGITKVADCDELFSIADVLSLHCPLTDDTRHLVNARSLALMKPEAILINTGRGPLVDEQALADALNEGRLYAAGIDVLAQEPPISGSPLISAKNCNITPHIAWATTAAQQRLLDIALANIKAYLSGEVVNQVNK